MCDGVEYIKKASITGVMVPAVSGLRVTAAADLTECVCVCRWVLVAGGGWRCPRWRRSYGSIVYLQPLPATPTGSSFYHLLSEMYYGMLFDPLSPL